MEIDRDKLARLTDSERERFAASHPRSRELFERSRGSLLAGVPMSWMARWAGGHPVFAAEAEGARVTDVDGNEYVDLCLGDTGAMAGHAPGADGRAVAERYRGGRDDDAPDRGLGLGRGGARAPVRPAPAGS